MPVTWADVSALDPALAAIPPASQTAILADAVLQVSPTTWEARTDLGVKYLAAHLGTLYLHGQVTAGGLVEEEEVGQVKRKYSKTSVTSGLQATRWGQEYERLLRLNINGRLFLVPR